MHVRCGAKSFKRFFGVAKRLRRHNSIIITMNQKDRETGIKMSLASHL
jgi:hypothetical protein